MPEFDADGVRFAYPDQWQIADESNDGHLLVTAQSPGSAFWTLAVAREATPESLLLSIEEAYREDFPDADIYDRSHTTNEEGETVLHANVDFVCLDFVVNAKAQAYRHGQRSIMVLTQVADIEQETYNPVFDAMATSLQVEDDPETLPQFYIPE